MDSVSSESVRTLNHSDDKVVTTTYSVSSGNIVLPDEIDDAYRLRHTVFAEELHWVPNATDGREKDAYDQYAEHFGVYREHCLLAYLRLVMPDYRFMLEKEFACLVSPEHRFRKNSDTCEVSRLCVNPAERGTKVETELGLMGVSMFLYRATYQWCLRYGVRYLYLVVEYKVFRLLSMLGFPCAMIGKPTRMPDGVMAVAAIMDWYDFETINAQKRPALLEWFSRSQSSQGGSQLPRLESGSPLQAFS